MRWATWEKDLEPDNVFGAHNERRYLLWRAYFCRCRCNRVAGRLNTQASIIIILVFCGLLAWTLGEYIIHRIVLHSIAHVQHGIHHARPKDPIDKIFWQIWVAFILVYMMAGGALLAGALVAYAWYLFVHYCAHHDPAILPVSLLKHQRDHHKFAS